MKWGCNREYLFNVWDRKSAVGNSDFEILNMVHIQFHAYLTIMCCWYDLNLGDTSKYSLVTPPLLYDTIYIWWNIAGAGVFGCKTIQPKSVSCLSFPWPSVQSEREVGKIWKLPNQILESYGDQKFERKSGLLRKSGTGLIIEHLKLILNLALISFLSKMTNFRSRGN